VVISVSGMKIEGDVKEVFHEKMGQSMMDFLATAEKQGQTARAVREGRADIKATVAARKRLTKKGGEGAARAMLARHPHTMSELRRLAKYQGRVEVLTEVLDQCGKWKEYCPYCFDIEKGEGHRDSRTHSRYECEGTNSRAVRAALKALKAERTTRAGTAFSVYAEYGHGAYVSDTKGKLAAACSGRAPEHGLGDRTWEEPIIDGEKADLAANRTVVLTTSTGKTVTATKDRVRILGVVWRGGFEDENGERFMTAAADLLDYSYEATNGSEEEQAGREVGATLSPTLLTWIHHCLGISQQRMVHPMAMTSGIFVGGGTAEQPSRGGTPALDRAMDEEGVPEVAGSVYSIAPTLLPGTVPPQDKGRWEAAEENESNCEWSQEPWGRSVVVCVAAAKDGSTVKLEQMIDKAIATATAGLRVVIVAEMPEKKEGRHAVSFEPPTGQWGEATNIMVIPPGRVPWKVGMEWSRDPDGNLCSTSREGSKEAAPRGLEETGRNTRSLMVWLYSAKADVTAGVISSQQLRELARILASTSGAMKMQGDIPVRWRNRGVKQWIDLALHSFDSTEDFDALEGLKASQEEESSEGQGRLADGVAPACLTRFFKTHGLKADEARAASAAVTAGCMNDVAEIYEPMVTAQAQALCASLGEPIGRTQRWQQGVMQYCECCAAMVTQTWSLPKKHKDPATQQTITDARAKRTKRIMEEELKFWLPVPLTAAEGDAKRRTEATAQGNEDRDARAGKRSGEGQEGAGAVEQMPTGDEQFDVDYGPEEVREAIQAAVNSEGMYVCAACVAPSMWAKRQHIMPGTDYEIREALMWTEVCALAQGTNDTKRGIKRFRPRRAGSKEMSFSGKTARNWRDM